MCKIKVKEKEKKKVKYSNLMENFLINNNFLLKLLNSQKSIECSIKFTDKKRINKSIKSKRFFL